MCVHPMCGVCMCVTIKPIVVAWMILQEMFCVYTHRVNFSPQKLYFNSLNVCNCLSSLHTSQLLHYPQSITRVIMLVI